MKAELQAHTKPRFTVGVCLAGEGQNVMRLVEGVLSEEAKSVAQLEKMIIVASACPPQVVSGLDGLQKSDGRIELIQEETRYGKADAINKIMDRAEGQFLVLVNSDARPEPGAIRSLLSTAISDETIGAVSAMPVTERRRDAVSRIVDLMWTTHNECSLALNHMNISNHACDELVLFRSDAVCRLPKGLVNDGAFMAGTARSRGYSVKFSTAAEVRIETPTRITDIIGQRRRILFGHRQAWRKTGAPPKTIESLILFAPAVGFSLFVRIIATHPRFLLVLPVAIVQEVAATLLSIWDAIRSSNRHVVWKRFV